MRRLRRWVEASCSAGCPCIIDVVAAIGAAPPAPASLGGGVNNGMSAAPPIVSSYCRISRAACSRAARCASIAAIACPAAAAYSTGSVMRTSAALASSSENSTGGFAAICFWVSFRVCEWICCCRPVSTAPRAVLPSQRATSARCLRAASPPSPAQSPMLSSMASATIFWWEDSSLPSLTHSSEVSATAAESASVPIAATICS
ncbi:hypothetical protein SAXI111661_07960 [Saccharomonospora xinjiangensis]